MFECMYGQNGCVCDNWFAGMCLVEYEEDLDCEYGMED